MEKWDLYTVEEKIQGELGEGGGLQMELLKGGSIWLGPRLSPGWDQVTALPIREMSEFLPVRKAVMWTEMKIDVTNEQCLCPNKAYKSLNVQPRPQHLKILVTDLAAKSDLNCHEAVKSLSISHLTDFSVIVVENEHIWLPDCAQDPAVGFTKYKGYTWYFLKTERVHFKHEILMGYGTVDMNFREMRVL